MLDLPPVPAIITPAMAELALWEALKKSRLHEACSGEL
jgi:hypothetical protein